MATSGATAGRSELSRFGTRVFRVRAGKRTGTAFTISPTLAVTCFHVVSEAVNTGERIALEDADGAFDARFDLDTARLADLYDLALLSIDTRCTSFIVRTSLSIDSRRPVRAVGYSDIEENYDVVSLEIEGPDINLDRRIKLKAGQVRPGHSGSPVLDPETEAVIGVLRFTRGRETSLGAIAIPIFRLLSYPRATPFVVPQELVPAEVKEDFRDNIEVCTDSRVSMTGSIGSREKLTCLVLDSDLDLLEARMLVNVVVIGVGDRRPTLGLRGFDTTTAQGVLFCCFNVNLTDMVGISGSQVLSGLVLISQYNALRDCSFHSLLRTESPSFLAMGTHTCFVDRCCFSGRFGCSVRLEAAERVVFRSCRFEDNGFALKLTAGTAADCVECTFAGTRESACIVEDSRLSLTRCSFESAGYAGCYVVRGGSLECTDSSFATGAYGIVFEAAHDSVIKQCAFRDIGQHGLTGELRTLSVEGCRFSGGRECGIFIKNVDRVKIVASEFLGQGLHGFEVVAARNVHFERIGTSQCAEHGGTFKKCENVYVRQLQAARNGLAGLYFRSCRCVSVETAKLLMNGDNGLSGFECGRVDVHGVTSHLNQLHGISLTDFKRASLSGSSFKGNRGSAMNIQVTGPLAIRGVRVDDRDVEDSHFWVAWVRFWAGRSWGHLRQKASRWVRARSWFQ